MPAAPRFWRRRGVTAVVLLPLTLLYGLVVLLRRALFRAGILRSERVGIPVVVVGNIAAGGSGKTPVVMWLVERLRLAGRTPGVISRGYGGTEAGPVAVPAAGDPSRFGDEPVLMALRTRCPVWIGRDRVAAARALHAAHPEVDVIVSDDGLQHYRLARDVELVVVDGHQLGNRMLMPSGPLREPLGRLAGCDLVLAHGDMPAVARAACPPAPVYRMALVPTAFYSLEQPRRRRSAAEFAGRRWRAIAGIGRPERFFETLRDLGVAPASTRAFPDHHVYTAEDLVLDGADGLLVTEKDAVKLHTLAPAETWVLPVDTDIRDGAFERILERLNGPQTA